MLSWPILPFRLQSRVEPSDIFKQTFWNFQGSRPEVPISALHVHMTEITQSDDDLLRLACGGDEDAFDSLYRRHQAGIFRYALQMTGSRHAAEDVTQEVFIALVRGIGFVSSRGSLSAYLYGIAHKHVMKHFGRDRRLVSFDDDRPEPSIDAAPLRDMTQAEAVEELRKAVLSLPPAYREAVVLCDLEEMSYVDAAAALGVPVGTVRSKLSRGRELLVKKLKSSSMRCTA
jgi:RNA polymerase sigma-70 factor (ECF subfamily)